MIVVDNASTDGTPAMVSRALPGGGRCSSSRRQRRASAAPSTPAPRRGRARRSCSSTATCSSSPGFLAAISRAAGRRPRGRDGRRAVAAPRRRASSTASGSSWTRGCPPTTGCGCGLPARRRACWPGRAAAPPPTGAAPFEAAGGFDDALFAYGEDVDLALRLRAAGWLAAGRGRRARHPPRRSLVRRRLAAAAPPRRLRPRLPAAPLRRAALARRAACAARRGARGVLGPAARTARRVPLTRAGRGLARRREAAAPRPARRDRRLRSASARPCAASRGPGSSRSVGPGQSPPPRPERKDDRFVHLHSAPQMAEYHAAADRIAARPPRRRARLGLRLRPDDRPAARAAASRPRRATTPHRRAATGELRELDLLPGRAGHVHQPPRAAPLRRRQLRRGALDGRARARRSTPTAASTSWGGSSSRAACCTSTSSPTASATSRRSRAGRASTTTASGPRTRSTPCPSARELLERHGYEVLEVRYANMLPLTVPGRLTTTLAPLIWAVNRILARVPGLNRLATNVELVARRR